MYDRKHLSCDVGLRLMRKKCDTDQQGACMHALGCASVRKILMLAMVTESLHLTAS
jgi:hypothetical protein